MREWAASRHATKTKHVCSYAYGTARLTPERAPEHPEATLYASSRATYSSGGRYLSGAALLALAAKGLPGGGSRFRIA